MPFEKKNENKQVEKENGICFTYNQEDDCFICSQGKTLPLIQKNQKRQGHFFNKYQCKQCSGCPVRKHCTKSKKGRIIQKRIDGEWLKAYKKKEKTEDFKEKFKQRKCVVEHPFGTMKYLMGQIPILLRGKEKVQVEMDLYSTAYNLIRMKNTETVPNLLEKLAKWIPLAASFALLLYFSSKKKPLYAVIYSN